MLSALVIAAALAPTFVTGADVSSLPACERTGARYATADSSRSPLAVLRERGVSLVRVRVWHSPGASAPESAPAGARALAQRAAALGLDVMLCLHFSDTWADPGKQAPPRAWARLRGRVLEDSVRAWTRAVVGDCVRAGVTPSIVQVGNEITHGLLWPVGRLGGADPRASRIACARLLRAAMRGVREASPSTRVALHIDRGGDPAGAERWFADRWADGVRPDVLALSYYPWWHGPLDSLSATLVRLRRFERPVLVAETAHPWTLGHQDDTHNVVGEPWRDPDRFGATPQGQRAFLRALEARLRAEPAAMGWAYWEPLDVTSAARGSAWENCALIDSNGAWLPAWEAFSSSGSSIAPARPR